MQCVSARTCTYCNREGEEREIRESKKDKINIL